MRITFENKMMVAAHRGNSYNYYENTMEAFRAAIESGADMIETDVHLTKDMVSNVKRNPDEYLYCACVFDDRQKEYYDYLQSKGIESWIGAGVTKAGHLKECYELGAKLVTTNFPGDCICKLEQIGVR